MTHSDLPAPVATYIAATNAGDIEALMASFAEDALVNDHRDEFAGVPAIRAWAEKEIIGAKVTMAVTRASVRGESAAVTAVFDGNFPKAGLPDPLLLTSYFSVSEGKIVQLVIVLDKPAG